MAFAKGQSGNPGGRPKDAKMWRDALAIAANRTEAETLALLADPKAPMIARAAARCVMAAAAEKVDVSAAKEVGDRLDGKPKQQTEVSGPDGGAITFGRIAVEHVDPNSVS